MAILPLYKGLCIDAGSNILLLQRQPDMERTSFAQFTLCPDDTLMELDNALADRQAQAQATRFPGEPGVDPVEAVEDALKLLVIDDLMDGLGMRRTRQAGELLCSLVGELGCGVLMSASDLEAVLVADRVLYFERGGLKVISDHGAYEAEVIPLHRQAPAG